MKFRVGDLITHPDNKEIIGLVLEKVHPRNVRKSSNPFYSGGGYYLVLNIVTGDTETWNSNDTIRLSVKVA